MDKQPFIHWVSLSMHANYINSAALLQVSPFGPIHLVIQFECKVVVKVISICFKTQIFGKCLCCLSSNKYWLPEKHIVHNLQNNMCRRTTCSEINITFATVDHSIQIFTRMPENRFKLSWWFKSKILIWKLVCVMVLGTISIFPWQIQMKEIHLMM